MSNKTIANIVIASLVVCMAGYFAGASSELYMLGGLGIMVGTVLMVIRIHKLNHSDWLSWVLGIVTGIFFLVATNSTSSSDISFWALAYWVFGVWGIIRLYQAK